MKNPHKMSRNDLCKHENNFVGMNALNEIYYLKISFIPGII